MNSEFPPILKLGPDFYDPVAPARFPKLQLRYRNHRAAQMIGLEQLTDAQWISHFGEFKALDNNLQTPLALRYHGHQFTHYNPELGDGRGFLFSQHFANQNLYDLGTKGSGQTPYSRQGDGRLTLKGAVREALATAMLEKLGVHASKTFSIIETGESLHRNDEPSPTRSAVLVRLNHSHIRFGTFQRLAYSQDSKNIQKLVTYCAHYYFPKIQSDLNIADHFFSEVMAAHARTTAQWMMCGFVHGVLNTDNMNITGETFDFGPYRFLPTYDIHFTAAYFDHQGLYSYGRQPISVLWNLEQLAKALSIGYPQNNFADTLDEFSKIFHDACLAELSRRLKIDLKYAETVLPLCFRFLELSKIPFEQFFHDLEGGLNQKQIELSPAKSFYKGDAWENLRSFLLQIHFTKEILPQRTSCHSLLYPEIELIWKKISEEDDWTLFNQKIQSLENAKQL